MLFSHTLDKHIMLCVLTLDNYIANLFFFFRDLGLLPVKRKRSNGGDHVSERGGLSMKRVKGE